MQSDIKSPDLYECPVLECYELFSEPVWHCPFCAHHWPLERTHCANCHQPSIEGRWRLTRHAVTARKVPADTTVAELTKLIKRSEATRHRKVSAAEKGVNNGN